MDEARAFLALPPTAAADGDSGDPGDSPGSTPGGPGDYDREAAARRLWRRCRPVEGSHAEAYLHARAIGHCRFPALRFHPALLHRDDIGVRRLPALVAAVTDPDGAIDGVQRTWLDPDRPAKADLARPRKALGRVYGRAVRFGALHFDGMRLGAFGATLLAGEGIETVLSLVTAVPGIDAAAALSAGSLGAFEPPPGLARLIVARDNDTEGERAFQRLKRRCAARGITSIAIVSDLGDFNDDLVAFGAETLAARIGPLIAAVPPTGNAVNKERGRDRECAFVISYCATRSHSANPCGVLHSVPATPRNATPLARLAPGPAAAVAQSLTLPAPAPTPRLPPAQAFRPSWLRCERVTQQDITKGHHRPRG